MSWWNRLSGFYQMLRSDVLTVLERDPAARSVLEVILTYSGLHAIWIYRVAHVLYRCKLYLLARVVSVWGRFLTGIEIHPGAKIGRECFIDHGTGVVVGETCEIGDRVVIYQGVTLGGTGKETGKRHPTIENDVMISSGAKVLGSIRVGCFSKIGAGAVVLREVPPHSTVVGVPGRVVMREGVRVEEELDHASFVETMKNVYLAMNTLKEQIEHLQYEVAVLKENRDNRENREHKENRKYIEMPEEGGDMRDCKTI